MELNMLHVSILIIAVAFAVLVIFLSTTIRAMGKTLNELTKTTASLEKQLQGITRETEELLHRTNALAADIQGKSEELNKLVHAVGDIGDTVSTFGSKVKGASNIVSGQLDVSAEKVVQASKVINLILDKITELRNNRALKKALQEEEK